MIKNVGGKTLVTSYLESFVPRGTSEAILGTKQTGLGKKGLLDLLNKYGR
jgi:hypothetical protein